MPRPAHPVLTPAELNRALLARQRLLVREAGDPVAVAGAVGGLQAQEPASPYLALLARVEGLAAGDVDRAFAAYELVKATLVRATLHAVPAADHARLWTAVAPSLHAQSRRRVGEVDPERLAALVEAVRAFAAAPRGNVQLRDHVGTLTPLRDGMSAEDAWWWARRATPLLHAPGAHPWSFGRRPTLVDVAAVAPAAVPVAVPGGDLDAAVVALVRRYLAAFGPASPADASAWSGIPVARLRPAIRELDAGGGLLRFADPRGRELWDLRDAPRPAASVPAPPRLLPMWDSLLLAHADRTRVISDEDRRRVVEVNGDTYPTFLVDGRVGGLWWAEAEPGGRSRIVLEPFRPLAPADHAALATEGERLAAFVAGREPDVYRRYRVSRARRHA